MGRTRVKSMTQEEYKVLKRNIENVIITDELVEKVWDYKWYGLCNNAKNGRAENKDGNHPAYENVKYYLGELKDVNKNIRTYDPKLYQKGLIVTRNCLEHRLNEEYSPTLHRLGQHYKYGELDILTAKEHVEIDNGKPVIIRGQFIFGKKSASKNKSEPLTIEHIIKMSKGKQFPSIIKAFNYIEKEFGIKPNTIYKLIDTGEALNTEKGSLEILRVESQKRIIEKKSEQFIQEFTKKYPQFMEALERFNKLITTPEGQKAFEQYMRISRIKRKEYNLKKNEYEKLKVK